MSDEYDGSSEYPICVTLNNQITLPGPEVEPAETTVFLARERSERESKTIFLGVSGCPTGTYVEVASENIRAVAHLGPIGGGADE